MEGRFLIEMVTCKVAPPDMALAESTETGIGLIVGGKLAIAARLDYYRGEIAPDFLEKAQERIDSVFATGEEGGSKKGGKDARLMKRDAERRNKE